MQRGEIIIVIIKYIRRTAFPPSNQCIKYPDDNIEVS